MRGSDKQTGSLFSYVNLGCSAGARSERRWSAALAMGTTSNGQGAARSLQESDEAVRIGGRRRFCRSASTTWIDEDNPVRAVDAFVDALDLAEMGFDGVEPAATGRPGYNPATLLKLYIYGYLNRVQSSRRLEREAGRNLELRWLLGRLVPDHKTIADFRRDSGKPLKRSARRSSSCAARWDCSRRRASPSAAQQMPTLPLPTTAIDLALGEVLVAIVDGFEIRAVASSSKKASHAN
jgi:hypothetical protein